jgi:hypothetical protein
MSETMYKWGTVMCIVGIILAMLAVMVPMHPNPRLALLIVAGVIGAFGMLSIGYQWYHVLRGW